MYISKEERDYKIRDLQVNSHLYEITKKEDGLTKFFIIDSLPDLEQSLNDSDSYTHYFCEAPEQFTITAMKYSKNTKDTILYSTQRNISANQK